MEEGGWADRARVLGAALLFATGGLAIKGTVLPGAYVAAGRSAVAVAVLWLAFPAWRGLLRPRVWLVAAAYGATLFLYVQANKLTTAAHAIFLQSTAPLYTLALAPRLLGERPRPRDGIAAAVLAAGLALLLAGAGHAQATAPSPGLGNALALASGLTWALSLMGLRWLGRDAGVGARAAGGQDPAGAARPEDPAGAAVIAGNVLACALAVPGLGVLPAVGALDVAAVLYLGLFQIGLAYVWLTRGVRGVRALEVSLLLALEPVANALLVLLVLGERLTATAWLGCGAVALGALLAAGPARRPAPA